MKKLLIIACAAALCLGCFGLVACGDGSSASGSSASSSSSVAENPAEKFVGEWTLAAAEGEGVTFAGDFGAMFGSEDTIALSLEEGGTGTLAVDAKSVGLTWEVAGDDTIAVTADSSFADLGLGGGKVSEDKKSVVVEGAYRDEMLALDLGNADYAAKMIFTHDGTIPGLPTLSAEAAEAVTAEKDLVGTWALGGVNMNGMLLYGDAKQLAALVGSEDVSLTIEEGGKAKLMGGEATCNVDDQGATLVIDGATVAVKKVEGDLLLEFSEADAGIPMAMRFAK